MIQHKKNTIYYLSFPAIDSATPASYKTGLSPVDTAYYKDGTGAWTSLAITDAAAEIGSTGVYEIDFSAAEMNHDKVFCKFAVSGMADDGYMFDMTQGIDKATLQNTTIATLATQVSFTLTAGSTNDDAYNNQLAVITDVATGTQKCYGTISDYTGSTKTVTLAADPGIFTMAATDIIDIIAVTGSSIGLQVDATGYGKLEVATQATIDDIPTTAEFEARTIAAASYFDPAADTVATVTSVTNGATSTKQDSMETTLNDVPTTAEFEARTLVAASYFDPAADTVATVTDVTNQVTVADILTTQMTEAYSAEGAAPTLAQSLFLIQQVLTDFAISGTTISVKKVADGTEAATITLDDGTNPTSANRAT
jgi:hypothetical protein